MKVEECIKLAQSYLAQGKLSEALTTSRKTVAQFPKHPAAYLSLGETLEAHKEPTAARDAYVKALEIAPQFFLAHAYLGQLYSAYSWLDEAAYHYQQALQFKPEWPELLYNLANVFHKQGNIAAAIDTYHRAIALRPGYISAYFNLGVVLDQNNQLDLAIEQYQQVIQYCEQTAGDELLPEYVNAYSNLGTILIRQGKSEDAIALYQQVLAVKPDSPTLYNNLGQVLFEKHPEQAIAAYQRAIKLQPDMVLAHYNLGKAWQILGYHEAAIPCFQKVVKLNKYHSSGYSDCGFSLTVLGRFSEALIYFKKAIELRPAFVKAYCRQVSLLQQTDDLERAQVACGRFLSALLEGREVEENSVTSQPLDSSLSSTEVCQHLAQTYIHLGNALVEYGGYKQAEIYYQKALQIQPHNAELQWRLGNCLAKQRRYSAAITIYQFAAALEPHHCQIYWQLGKVFERQRQYNQALTYYQKVLDLQAQPKQSKAHWEIGNGDLIASTAELAELPKGIYLSTWHWILAHQIDPSYYLEIVWMGQESETAVPQKLELKESQKDLNYDCGGLTCEPCLKQISEWFSPIHLGWGTYLLSMPEQIPASPPKTFVARVPKGRVWTVPQQNSWLLCTAIAILTPDNYLLADISRDYPGKLPGCQKHDPAKHSIFDLETFPPLKQIEGKVAVLSGLSGNVYFHWMVDVLPRIELLRQSEIDFAEIDWFLVNNYRHSFQRETLATLGIPETKILESDGYPHIQATELIVPSFPGYLGWSSPWVIDFLRRSFLPKMAVGSSYPERIYISRNKARYRRVLNEEEVVEQLSQHGFVRIFLETLPLAEQIALFFHAKVIISPHGSGLTNTVFCRPGTKVLEFVSPHYVSHYYWANSHYLKLQHYYLVGEVFECYPLRNLMYQNPLTEDILINLSALKKMLEVAGVRD